MTYRMHMRTSTRHLMIVAALAALGCAAQDAPKVPLALASRGDSARQAEAAHALIGPAARAALDSGNVLFRKRSYAAALAQYRSASALAPQHAAPFFGMYMVARATSDSVLADSALAGIRLRNGPMTAAPHSLSDSALRRMHESLRKRGVAGT